MWWGDVHCSFQRVGELKSTQEDTFVLSTSSVPSLGRPVLSLLVILAAGFYIPSSGKKALFTPKCRAAVKGCPAHTSNSAFCFQMGLTQVLSSQNRSLKVKSWADWLEEARLTQRPSKESDDLLKLLWESQPQKSAFSVFQGVFRMEIQWGCLWQRLG